jgi:putative ABC transport system permease protein
VTNARRPPVGDNFFVRVYRRLTRLYPAAFQDEYRTDMVEMAKECDTAEGSDRRLLTRLALLGDIFLTAPQEHLRMLGQDLRHALRVLAASPALTVPIVLVLAIGIGATTGVFTIANAVLLRPLPFAEPDRLVLVDETDAKQGVRAIGTALPNLREYQQHARSLEGVGAFFHGGFTLTGSGDPERVSGAWVSWNLFAVLGVAPALGRHFVPEEDGPGIEDAVLLGHGLWQRRFGGDRAIVGQRIEVSGRARTVVGIMPPDFRFPENGELWAPMSLHPHEAKRTDHFLTAIARLAPGVSREQARAEVSRILDDIRRQHPAEAGHLGITVLPLRDRLAGEYAPALVRLAGAVLLLLAVTCMTVMNLLLARAASRRREFAVRAALGANRRRVLRQLLTESLVLGLLGAALGVALGTTAMPALLRAAPIDVPYWIQATPDWRVLLFTAAVVLAATIAFGLAPAFHATSANLGDTLRESSSRASSGPRVGRLRQGLVALQLALSVVLLAAAGLMVRSQVNLGRVDLGFRGDDTLSFWLALPPARYPEPRQCAAFFASLLDELRAAPGVERVSAVSALPLVRGGWRRAIGVEGTETAPVGALPNALHVVVTSGYFQALGIPLEGGRDFDASDGAERPAVIVSRSLAERFWPGQDPVGQRLKVDPFQRQQPWRVVVGVVRDVRAQGPREAAPMTVYVPHAFEPLSAMTIVLRSSATMATLPGTARAVVSRLDPQLPLSDVRPVETLVERAQWHFRLYTRLFVGFALIALVLAALGLAGVMSHLVVERRQEIGVRLALGASPSDAFRLILNRVVALLGVGLAVGVFGTAILSRALGSLLFGVPPRDLATLAAVLATLAVVGLLAGAIPARRAAHISPITALRS